MDFDQQKQQYQEELGKPDKSRAGGPDPQIVPLLNAINATNDYYTTSSCAGRILIAELTPGKKKHETNWLYVSHDPADAHAILQALEGRQKQPGYEIWFKMESPILHLCARNLDAAEAFIVKAKEAGIKRATIMGTNKRIMLEMMDNHKIETLIAKDGKLLIDEQYLALITDMGNRKLAITRQRLDAFSKLL